MKRLIFAILAAITCANNVTAQKKQEAFKSVAAGIGIASTGFEMNVATPLPKHFTLQAGIAFMPGFKTNTDVMLKLPNILVTQKASVQKATCNVHRVICF